MLFLVILIYYFDILEMFNQKQILLKVNYVFSLLITSKNRKKSYLCTPIN